MPHDDIKQEIEEILRANFQPIELEVIDDSHKHRNHTEARLHPQAGHFKVFMKSARFDGKNAVMRHRMVYQELGPLMDAKIHALSLNLLASNE
jgi:BolA family transcriptional regulator, general stress-responsive regulator